MSTPPERLYRWKVGLIYYGLPIVVSIIDKIDLPEPLARLKPKEKGNLKVTLAVKLAQLVTRLLVAEITRPLSEGIDNLYAKDDQIAECTRTLNELVAQRERLHAQLENWERALLAGFTLIAEDGDPKIIGNHDVVGKDFPWRIYAHSRIPGCSPNRKAVLKAWKKLPERAKNSMDSDCAGYIAQGRKLAGVRWQVRALRRRISKYQEAWKDRPEFKKDLGILMNPKAPPHASRARPRNEGPLLKVDFLQEDPLLRSELCRCLQADHYLWWSKFTSLISHAAEISTKKSYLLLGRDPVLQRAIHEATTRQQNRLTLDGATHEVWKSPCKYRPGWLYPPYLGKSRLDRARRELSTIDAEIDAWIRADGGDGHPFNIYATGSRTWMKANGMDASTRKICSKNAKAGKGVPYGSVKLVCQLLKVLQTPRHRSLTIIRSTQ